MKKLILVLSLIALSSCNFLSEETYSKVKRSGLFEVDSPSESPFAKYTDEEISKKFNYGSSLPKIAEMTARNKVKESSQDLPEYYDARMQYPFCSVFIKNQQECNSSTVFASVSSLSFRYCMATGKNIEFSTQDQIACVHGNQRCKNGNLDTTFKYLELIGALSEDCFPFVSGNITVFPKCPSECSNPKAEFRRYYAKEWQSKPLKTLKEIKEDIYNNGPVLAGIVLFDDLLLYKKGIYTHVPGTGKQLGWHALVLYGWRKDEETGKEYFFAQNSWGKEWGMEGMVLFDVESAAVSYYGYSGIPYLD